MTKNERHVAGGIRPAPLEVAALFILLVLASTRLIVRNAQSGQLLSDHSPLLYQAATLGFNYFEFGAVRRGLGGSMTHLMGSNLLLATVWFHLAWSAVVAALAAWLFRRIDAPWWNRLAYALVVIAIMLRWAEDAGRIDTAIGAVLALATLAMRRDRLDLALLALGIGLFMHETSMIFGLPLLVALVRVRGGWRVIGVAMRRRAAVVMGAGLAAYAGLGLLPHAGTRFMVDTVRAKFAPHPHVDWAIFFAVSGRRGVQDSICQNLTDPSYFIHPLGGLLVLLMVGIALSRNIRRDWRVLALAALPGFVFLCAVANDVSRWTMFGALNMWLVGVSCERRAAVTRLPAWAVLAAALSIVPLTHPRIFQIPYPVYAGSTALEWLMGKLHGPRTPGFEAGIDRCDPDWLRSLNEP